MRICKRCRQEINPRDVKTELLDNKCWCFTCHKAKQDERNAKYSASCKTPMMSAGKWKLGETYSTKGLSMNNKMNYFMSAVLECQDAGLKA